MKKWQKILLKVSLYILYIFFSLGVPIWLIAEKYNIFSTRGSLTGVGMIVCIIIVFFFYKKIKEAAMSITIPVLKGIIVSIIRVLPLVALCIAVEFASVQIADFKFIMYGSLLSNATLGSVFYTLFQKFKTL